MRAHLVQGTLGAVAFLGAFALGAAFMPADPPRAATPTPTPAAVPERVAVVEPEEPSIVLRPEPLRPLPPPPPPPPPPPEPAPREKPRVATVKPRPRSPIILSTTRASRAAKRLTCSLRFEIAKQAPFGPSPTHVEMTMALPRDWDDRQRILSRRYSTQPTKEFDQDGNHYAQFTFEVGVVPVSLVIDMEAEVYQYDWSVARSKQQPYEGADTLRPWLAHARSQEKDDPAIQQAAYPLGGSNDVDTARKVFGYVIALPKRVANGEDRGALRALKDGGGDCSEFSDLYVTLCRAQNVPARTCHGYVLCPVPKNETPKHAWSEVYLEGHGWVPFDPMHAATGGATFDQMTPERLYLSHLKFDPALDNSHSWFGRFRGDMIEVKDRFTLHSIQDFTVVR